MLKEHRLFFRQFRESFRTTGAIAPSSPALCSALTRCLRSKSDAPRRILEVGPGTGAVTRHIVRRLQEADRLDLVELNEEFVAHLNDRFLLDRSFARARSQAQVIHASVEELAPAQPYDVIISGLPLNNFSVELVEKLLASMLGLLAPGGSLSFFEYAGVRSARALVSGPEEKERLQGINEVLNTVLRRQRFRRDLVLLNLPPAMVHHVRTA